MSNQPIFADTFDDYSASTELWDYVSGTVLYSSSYSPFPAVAGLNSQGIKCNSQAAGKLKILPSNYSRIVMGVWVYVPNVPGADYGIIGLCDGSYNHIQFKLAISGSLAPKIYGAAAWTSGGAGTLLATGPAGVFTVGWHFVEMDMTFNGSTGSVSLWVDQAAGASPIFTATGLNTAGSGLNQANELILGDLSYVAAGFGWEFKDVYVLDGNGSTPNRQLGMCRGFTKATTAAGDLTNGTPNGAVSDYQCVQSFPPNDSKYVSFGSNVEDTYTMQSAGLTANPLFVMNRIRAWIDDAGPHTMSNVIRSSGVDSTGPANSISATPKYYDYVAATDPNTGYPWAFAAADAAQSGEVRVS
jgi:hypothetical protein